MSFPPWTAGLKVRFRSHGRTLLFVLGATTSMLMGYLKKVFLPLYALALCAFVLCGSGCDQAPRSTASGWEQRNNTLLTEISRLRSRLEASEVNKDLYDEIAAAIEAQEAALEMLSKENETLKANNADLLRLVAEAQSLYIQQLEEMGAKIKQNEGTGEVLEIDFRSSSFSNENGGLLSKFPSVKKLMFYGPNINNETMAFVAGMEKLEHLDITRTSVGDDGLAHLTGLEKLKFLQMFRCDVTDEGFKSIAQMPGIQQIRCGQTRITDEALQNIKDVQSVTALDLSDCNQITNDGVGIIAGFPKLRFVKVWGKQITDEGILQLANLENLEVVGLNDTGITDAAMAAFRGKRNLKELHLVRCTLVGDEGLLQLADCRKMEQLHLRDTGITGAGLEALSEMTNLKLLDLSETLSPGIDDAGLAHISHLTSLEDLNVWRTQISDAGVAHLANLTNLKKLNLDKSKVGDGAMEVVSQFKDLEWLHIGSNDKITDEGAAKLTALKKLGYLNITFLLISDDVIYDLEDNLLECQIVGP